MANLFNLSIFKDAILPFLFVFVITFAILEKTKIFGEGKSQINAITGFVLAAIVLTFAKAVGIITQLSIFLVIAIVILLTFMIISGFASGSEKDIFEKMPWFKVIISWMAFIAVIIAVLVITGWWSTVYDFFKNSEIGANVIFIILIIGAVVAVILSGKKA